MRSLFIALSLLIAVSATAQENMLVGADSATFEWTQPEGVSPDGWNVYVSRDGGEYVNEASVTVPSVTVGASGILIPSTESFSLKASSVLGTYESPLSVASEAYRFVPLPPPGGMTLLGFKEVAPGVYIAE